ncbi:MAG: DUF1330 domain-containing protein [Gammaproteobacteria bacterium]|jgi:uncharacterized protein (DUF1330 family)|tara:strand:- start:370 stop:870 length:501 start_codon:yes stop_codon:yes gene_type:complete
MKKYLIGLVIISGLMFFLISNDSDSNESNSYKNALRPNPIQLAEFALGDDDPILMVNLLKFKDKAEYEDGRATNLTGREAYEIYVTETREHLANVGAELILGGEVNGLLLGEVEELWDAFGVARYPSRKAMIAMARNPAYIESEKHRAAGLAGQLNIEVSEQGFGF